MGHGQSSHHGAKGFGRATCHEVDWTDGCIAVTDREMDEVWQLVPVKVLDYRLKDLKLCPVYDSVFACQGYSGNSFLL